MNVLLKSVTLLNPAAGYESVRDVLIDGNGMLLSGEAADGLADVRVIDASRYVLTPGLVDIHVHFRDPGTPEAETLQSGARAAAAGGFTKVVTMPNTTPPGDTPAWCEQQLSMVNPCRVYPAACITKERRGTEVADMPALAAAGAVAFTDDGAMVADAKVMHAGLLQAKRLDKCVMDHAVLPALAGDGVIRTCPTAEANKLPIFPPEAEVEAVRQDIALATETGAHVHIQHLSCAESVKLIADAQRLEVNVTAEVTPHHLALAAEDIPGDDGNWRMNPPLGIRADVEALRRGVCDGTLTCFATDHAPHVPDRKEKGFLQAAFGVIGLETAAAVTWDVMVKACGLSPLRWAAMWTTAPAFIVGIELPALKFGAPADCALFVQEEWTYDTAKGASKSRNSPFNGRTFGLKPVMTFCGGVKTYDQL